MTYDGGWGGIKRANPGEIKTYLAAHRAAENGDGRVLPGLRLWSDITVTYTDDGAIIRATQDDESLEWILNATQLKALHRYDMERLVGWPLN